MSKPEQSSIKGQRTKVTNLVKKQAKVGGSHVLAWKVFLVAVIALVAVAVWFAYKNRPKDRGPYVDPVPMAGPTNVTGLPFELVRLLSIAHPADNVVASPAGLASMIGMMAMGTDRTVFQDVMPVMGNNFMPLPADGPFKFSNSIWLDDKYVTRPQFTSLVTPYTTVVDKMDFGDKSSEGRLNEFIYSELGGDIGTIDMILPDNNVSMLALGIGSFTGRWLTPFTYDAEPTIFNNEDNTFEKTTFLMLHAPMRAYDDGKFIFVSLPYSDGDYELAICCPKYSPKIPPDWSSIEILYSGNQLRDVTLHIPAFEFVCEQEYAGILQAMGIRRMFAADADFRMVTSGNVQFSNLVQRIHVRFDAEGREAAVGRVAVRTMNTAERHATGQPINVVCDKPFYIVMMPKVKRGLPLLVGYVRTLSR